MKIIYIAETIGGGVRKHLSLLLDHLSDKYEIVVIHGKRVDEVFTKEKELYQKEGIKFYQLNYFCRELNLIKDIKAGIAIRKIIKEENPEIVHCHSSKAGILGRFSAKLMGVKKIFYTPHGYAFQSQEFSIVQRRLFATLERFFSRYLTTKTFNVSNGEMYEALKRKIDKEDKFEVIYNGLPDIEYPSNERLRQLLMLPEDSIIIGNCARITSQKNPEYFIKLAKEVVKENANIHFVWIGSGKTTDIEKYNSIHQNIHFMGFRDDSEFLMKDFDVFLTTSNYEGLPYSLVESIRAGVPIIATDVVGNNEVVIPEVTGFLIGMNNETILPLINKAMKLDRIEIRNLFLNQYQLSKMISLIVKNYRQEESS